MRDPFRHPTGRIAAPLSLACAVLIAAGCSGRGAAERDAASGAGATASTAASDSGSYELAGYTPAVVAVNAQDILDRAQRGGNVTLVNLWATWCAPCRHEMPALLRVARAHRADGVRLMLVSTDFDDQIATVRRFLATHAVDETTFIKTGDDNTFINALHADWSGALPATLVFDRSGRLTDFWEGAADENRFEHAVIAALTERNPRGATP